MNINPTSRPATIMEIYTNKVYCISNNEGCFTPVMEKKLLQQIDAQSTNIANNPFPKIPFRYKLTAFWNQHGTKIIVGIAVFAIATFIIKSEERKAKKKRL